MSEIYFVDAYNVMHKSSILRPLARRDFEAARESLIEKVAQYVVATGKKVYLVFDGRGRTREKTKGHAYGVPGMTILYSPHDLSADAVIEREIYKQSNRLDTIVVSNDQSLRDLCRGMGALTMDADHFITAVRETRQEVTRTVTATQQETHARTLLEEYLDPAALAKLQTLRGRLKK